MQKWGGTTKDDATRAGRHMAKATREKGAVRRDKSNACRRGEHMYMAENGHQQMKKKKEKKKKRRTR